MPELQKPATLTRPGQPTIGAPASAAGAAAAAKPADPAAAANSDAPGTPPPPRRSQPWKLYLIAGGLGFFVIAMILVAVVGPRNTGSKAKPKELVPTPTTVPRPSIPDFSLGEPSIYANDPQILQLEGAIKTYERQLDTVDLREQELDPPILDMTVDFTLPKK